jgi:hypothetical protein
VFFFILFFSFTEISLKFYLEKQEKSLVKKIHIISVLVFTSILTELSMSAIIYVRFSQQTCMQH